MNFEKMDEKFRLEILSPNFSEDDIEEWTNRSMMIPHEPIRAGLKTLIEITKEEYYDGEDAITVKKKIDLLFKWYNEHFAYFVSHHHAIEEHVYFPWVASMTEQAMPEKFAQDHGEMITMLQNIKNSQMTFNGDDGQLDMDNFKNNLNELHLLCEVLSDDMIHHLNEEERIVPELLRFYRVKQVDEKVVIDKIVKQLGLKGNRILLPWICDSMYQWGGPQKVKEFMSRIPLPIRFIKWLSWDRHYVKRNKNIIQKIREL